MNRKTMLRALILSAVLVAALVVGVLTQWRLRAVALKLGGELPAVSWRQLGSLFTLGADHDPRQDLDAGLVTLARDTGEGLCPILWSTPLGDIRGGLDDRPALELMVREQLIDRIYHNSSVAVTPGDVVIDVGGHLGTFTRFALDRGARQVIVFEPEPRNVACFELAFEEEIRAGKVVLIDAAAWRSVGVLHFRGQGSTGQVNEGGEIEVRAVTIDEVVEDLALDRVDFIKMDIEGAELDALVGAQRTLRRFGPQMALSIYHNAEHPREIPRLALAAYPGYRLTTTREFAYFF